MRTSWSMIDVGQRCVGRSLREKASAVPFRDHLLFLSSVCISFQLQRNSPPLHILVFFLFLAVPSLKQLDRCLIFSHLQSSTHRGRTCPRPTFMPTVSDTEAFQLGKRTSICTDFLSAITESVGD